MLPKQRKLRERVSNALRKIETLECSYQDITVGQLVSMRARTDGSTTAIDVFGRGERATYSEMDRLSNRYAHALRAFGVRKRDRIGVMLPNRIAFPIVWFAIAKLGAVMVPINMRYTPREINYVLGDTQARFAIIDESVTAVFSAMEPWPQDLAKERVILIGQSFDGRATSLDELLKGADDSIVEEDVRPDDLLNIQYTSGTTGFPKGCMLTHDYWGVTAFQAQCGDEQRYQRYISIQPFFYGDPQVHLLKSYRQAGTLYLAPSMSSTRFIDWIRQYRIEWCFFPELIARQAEATNDEDGATCLKQALTWGCSPDTQRKLRKRFRVRTQDAYGMTEIGFGTQMPNDLDEMADSGSVGIRAPFRNLRLMNCDGTPTAVGEVGELWVSGRGILKGYWNRPEANASFKDGWFRTGDLLRRDDLGFYWLVGRTKDMIRRSGENIAAREVEAVIREIPEIADVAAVPVPDAKRGEEVKIYVELKEGLTPGDLPVDRILEHVRISLAVFKVPRYIAFTPVLPRTSSSNKVLKRELMAVSNPLAGAYDVEEKRWR